MRVNRYEKGKRQICAWIFFVAELLVQLVLPESGHATCTLGLANGYATVDGRPIFWKVGDSSDKRQQLVYISGSPYDYIGVRSEGGPIFTGLNEAGIASGNSLVITPGGPAANSALQRHIWENFSSLDQVRDYIADKISLGDCNASGCFPFIDADRNAIMFEINRSNWWWEYDSVDPDRGAQGLLGFVVRANEFHDHSDGTDDTSIGDRYESGTYNISGLVSLGMLSPKTIFQGSNDPNSGFEVARYGPGRRFESIARSITVQVTVVHGVLPNEDPALTTAWVILGQSNFGIAVPAWVRISNIPQCLASGDMYDRAKSLFNKGDETTTQTSTFPVEKHMFDVVLDTLLPHWRFNGVPSVNDVNRIEHQMAADAYSLLYCLDNNQSDNRAAEVTFNALPDGLIIDFELIAEDLDGTIDDIQWNFGDNKISTDASPSHTYSEAGTYLVSCTVTDDDGVSITDWRYYGLPVDCDLAGNDGVSDMHDFAKLVSYWLASDCGEPSWCEGADLDRNTRVDLVDLAIFAQRWAEDGR